MGCTPADLAVVTAQLGREPRAIDSVAFRCPCGAPAVVRTQPRLPEGTPFPTTYYVTCPRLTSLIGTLEATGVMRQMEDRIREDADMREQYEVAHERYLADRAELGDVPEIDGISAGGMPTRVKCLHVHVGQALACGSGVNPVGDEVLDRIGSWWAGGPCV
jgi:hypothetical protein